MKQARHIGTGLLLLLGFWCLGRALETSLDRNPDRLGKRDTITAGVLMGLPSTAAGIGLALTTRRQAQQQRQGQLRQAFFRQLQLGQGQITPLGLAMVTGLSGAESQAYLDDRAREFNATFQLEENGDLIYCFSLGPLDYGALPAAAERAIASGADLRFDVILVAVPDAKKREITRVVQKLTGSDWKTVKILIKTAPQPLHRGASLTTAREFQQALEAVGAQVMIALKS